MLLYFGSNRTFMELKYPTMIPEKVALSAVLIAPLWN